MGASFGLGQKEVANRWKVLQFDVKISSHKGSRTLHSRTILDPEREIQREIQKEMHHNN